jgi:uncharacterized protein (TIGR02231 family)
MRIPLLLAAAFIPASAFADTIEAPSRVVSVTVYPWGASVVRRVEFTAPAGVHELVVPDLPPGTPADALRVAGPEGMTLGAVTLATGRLPAYDPPLSDEVRALEGEVERLEAALRARNAAIAAIRLKSEAANEQLAFLRSLGQGLATEGAALQGAQIRELARLIGEEALIAREAAHAAEQEAEAAEREAEDLLEDFAAAQQALEAARAETYGRTLVSLSFEAAAEGPAAFDITTFTQQASWAPVYDLRLTKGDTPALEIERGVLVSQYSGEDWTGIDLVLSTARPSERSNPSELSPWLRYIINEEELARAYGGGAQYEEALAAPAMIAEEAPGDARARLAPEAAIVMQGATVTYTYGAKVDIRDGVENLRLRLDSLNLSPEIEAVAVPLADPTAYLVASFVNEAELILPGQATLFLDGAMVGQATLPLIASGDEAEFGFGAIDGIRLTRTVPNRSEGERGLLASSNELEEVAILEIENLTGEEWKMRVLDRVPYSEQDDLEIDYTATPPATEADVEGQRGILAWEFVLAPGTAEEIRLEHSMSWPEGYVME